MKALDVRLWQAILERDDDWVERGQRLVEGLTSDKERQLRNIQNSAEQAHSWRAVRLLIEYQAARKQLPEEWAQQAVSALDQLQADARALASRAGQPNAVSEVHLHLVARVLGYAVRWHVCDTRGGGMGRDARVQDGA